MKVVTRCAFGNERADHYPKTTKRWLRLAEFSHLCDWTSGHRVRLDTIMITAASLVLRRGQPTGKSKNSSAVLHTAVSERQYSLIGGSLGSWVDEERSKVRYVVLSSRNGPEIFEYTWCCAAIRLQRTCFRVAIIQPTYLVHRHSDHLVSDLD